jgi:oligopeptide transport system permease protein
MALTEPTVEAIIHHDAAPKGRSLWSDARRRFFRNKAATISLVALILIAIFAFFGELVSPHRPVNGRLHPDRRQRGQGRALL